MPGYVWTGPSTGWKTITAAWIWSGSQWKNSNGWIWNGSTWKDILSFGTFSPEIRDANGNALSYRNVGIAMVGYRGYTTSGISTFQWEYSVDNQINWSPQTASGNSGTFAATTLTSNYTTDTSDVAVIESLFLNNNIFYYMRLRVTRSGETQYSQSIRVGKRTPINASSTLSLLRNSSQVTTNLTGSQNERNPYVSDQVFWTPNFTSTVNITNDTRPDYYVFTFTTNSGVTENNSRYLDISNPRNPLNSRRYIVQSSDIGGSIICTMNAWNSNENAPTTTTITTRPVSSNVLVAPTNLVSSYVNLSIVGNWSASTGGNDTTINYVAYLYQNNSLIYTSPSTVGTTFSYAISTAGDYKFKVIANQTGSTSVESDFSNITTISPPSNFSASIADVTTEYPPGVFSINTPTLSTTTLNRWDWTWNASTDATVYDSTILRPNGTTSTTSNISTTTDYWGIVETGTYRETVTAINKTTNYVRLSWTKPFGTSAVSYKVYYTRYIGVSGTAFQINVEDVTFLDVSVPYKNDSSFSTGNSILLSYVVAYSGPNQTGSSIQSSAPSYPNNYSIANKTSSRTVFRDDYLVLENTPQVGFLYVTGRFEPGEVLGLTGSRPSSGVSTWSPAFEDPGWTHNYKWYKKGTVSFQAISGAVQSSFYIPLFDNYIGNNIDASVTSTFKGISFAERFDSTPDSDSLVTPIPPAFNLVDNGNRTFSTTGITSTGATFYYGTYSGSSSGTVSETAIASTFTSSQVAVGTINVALNARKYVNLVYPSVSNNVQINSLRSTASSLSVAASPQDTGSRRWLKSIYVMYPGTTFYISTNGYLGLQSTTSGSSVSIPNDGSWLNIAQADLQQQYLYTLATKDGFIVRYRGNRLGNSSQILEYQAYYPYGSSWVFVNFIENSISGYLSNVAWKSFGSVFSTWTNDSVVDSGGTGTDLISVGTMIRNASNDSIDDAVTPITVIAPAILMNSNPIVTRTAGGFTFNITDSVAQTFDSTATYASSVIVGTGTASINASTGLVTITGMSSSTFVTVRIAKAKSGYTTSSIEVQGQALAGAAPTQATAISTSVPSGTSDSSGTLRRVQSGGQISGTAGTYNNQQSINSGWLTLPSSSYTGTDSNWTSLSVFTTSNVLVGDVSASSSANMYRWRDRVIGTDGSTVDFYSVIVYRAVYAQPSGVSENTGSRTQTSITLNYTGYAAQRIYKYRDGIFVEFIVPPASGPATTSFGSLTAGTSYSLLLYGANNEGYLSVNASGGSYSTVVAVSPPTINSSSNTSNSITLNFTRGANSTSVRAYIGGNFDGSTTNLSYTFSGLSASTNYSLQLYGFDGTTLSSTSSGGTYATAAVAIPSNTSQPTLSGGTVVGNTVTFGVGGWSNSPTSYSLQLYRGTQFVSSSETRVSLAGNVTSSNYVIQQADFNSGQRYLRAFASATNAGGTSALASGQEIGPITEPVVVLTPTVGTPSISFASSATTYTWTVSASATNATNVEFNWEAGSSSSGPATASGTVFAGAGSGTATATFTQTVASGRNWGRVRARANNSSSGLSSAFTGFTAWT